MSSMAMNVSALESGLLSGAHSGSMMRSIISVADGMFPGALCSDCCGSNGNDCSPTGEPYPEDTVK